MRVVKITNNGEWIGALKVWVGGTNSGGAIGVGLNKDGRLWVTARECLKEFTVMERMLSEGPDLNCYDQRGYYPNEILYFTNYYHRFQINKSNNLYFIAIKGKMPQGLYIINKEGKIISKYILNDMGLNDIATDSAGNSYVAFIKHTISGKSSGGIVKLNENAEPVKWLYLDDVRERHINIAIDGNDKVYLSLKDFFNVYDSDLNLIESNDFKNLTLGEIGIISIDVDKEGDYLYAIDSQYNRIIKYDLKDRRLFAKQKSNVH